MRGCGPLELGGFDKLLCDDSTIESITNSNHTLESTLVNGYAPSNLSTFAEQLLALNVSVDKAKVIRSKTQRFYFAGEFDVSPFSTMPLSVLPEMSRIQENDNQSAMYRLLQCLPELRNVSERKSCEQPGNKRHKTIRFSV
jgi:hypothetical protein